MDNVKGAHGFSGHRPVCLDIVQGISGQCPYFPLIPWIMSRESMVILQGDGTVDNVHWGIMSSEYIPPSPSKLSSLSGLLGLCLEYPWILSSLSTKSMDIVQGDSGECLLSQWTLSSLSGLTGLCPEYPWTLFRLSTDSMNNVQGVHGNRPRSPWIHWTFSKQELCMRVQFPPQT